jgi:hypothetical protein
VTPNKNIRALVEAARTHPLPPAGAS